MLVVTPARDHFGAFANDSLVTFAINDPRFLADFEWLQPAVPARTGVSLKLKQQDLRQLLQMTHTSGGQGRSGVLRWRQAKASRHRRRSR